jgi:hypothetical protein
LVHLVLHVQVIIMAVRMIINIAYFLIDIA